MYKNSVCIGAGLEGEYGTDNIYSRSIIKSVLSKDYIHSVRDEISEKYLTELGFKVINTGCPTLWNLNAEHCSKIPQGKSNRVVFTFTQYKSDRDADQNMLDTLLESYEEVFYWPQDPRDYDYLLSMNSHEKVKIISPSLKAYKELLSEGEIDFVGTRLHAGIYAMQHKVRAIIIIVDNRARDMQDSFNINAIERSEMSNLKSMINSEFPTNIKINEDKINEWKSQFTDY
jgi:polysaccharide pyruvyl transferase WcaK-like protein